MLRFIGAAIDDWRAAMKTVKDAHPFAILAMVVLPDHLHAIWRLPPDDAGFSLRWSLIKAGFSRRLAKGEYSRASRQAKRERGIWQRRYREHQIRDEIDLARHVDYIHFNSVNHSWGTRSVDWPHSTLHGTIERGMAASDWGGELSDEIDGYGER